MKVILIRYGELTLKGKNRKEFERILYNNIKKQLEEYDVRFNKDRNRIYLYIDTTEQYEQIKIELKRIPGISSFSIADTCELNIEEIKELAVNSFDEKNPIFKVETKRSNKQFFLTSQEVSKEVGGHVLYNKSSVENIAVDVHNPQQVIKIEIQRDKAYVFHTQEKAMGGLPIGTAGRGVVLLSGGIDSPVAAVLAMKRGVKITCVHFSSPPYTNEQSLQKVLDLTKVLQQYDRDIKLYDVHFSELQLEIGKACEDRFGVTLLRRMMLRMASKIAKEKKAKVLITGESLGQVASQTLSSMAVTDQTVEDLILRPLITFDKTEIIDIARKIGTYEISILPYEDCCVIFLPKNPVISPKLTDIIKEESKFNYQTFLDNSERICYDYDIINKNDKLIDKFI